MIEYGPVFLIKENNVTTEQTFEIAIQLSAAVPPGTNLASFLSDYLDGGVFWIFPPNLQRLNIDFILYSDNIPEGNEAFLFEVFALHVVGEYLPPMFASALINILDDDREFQCI